MGQKSPEMMVAERGVMSVSRAEGARPRVGGA